MKFILTKLFFITEEKKWTFVEKKNMGIVSGINRMDYFLILKSK